MTVLEPGCGMGTFTLDLARMVGREGRVVAIDLQEHMLEGMRRRARRADLLQRIDIRRAGPSGLNVADLAGQVDLTLALHMVYDVHGQGALFTEFHQVLRTAGALSVVEPKGHVSKQAFSATVCAAEHCGFRTDESPIRVRGLAALLRRAAPPLP